MKARKGQPVRVTWLDAANGQGWWGLDQLAAEKPCEIVSIGYLVYADKERVVLTTSISGDEGLGWVVIPAKWVTDVRVLEVGKEKESGR